MQAGADFWVVLPGRRWFELIAGGPRAGGGVFNHQRTVHVKNSIIAGNTASHNNPDLEGAFLSNGRNLITSVGTATGLMEQNTAMAQINLSPLALNGGYTPTHAIAPGSIALGRATLKTAIDQRGVARRETADVGAFQRDIAARITRFGIRDGRFEFSARAGDWEAVVEFAARLEGPWELLGGLERNGRAIL
jgi:hypothetical protein